MLIQRFGWITHAFGAFLILTAIKMALAGNEGVHPDKNILVRMVREDLAGHIARRRQHFFTKVADWVLKRAATPLFLALVVVEFTDVNGEIWCRRFSSITGDPFIVLTSMCFAILGLRSLYFLLANMLNKFRHQALRGADSVFVGIKMLLVHSWFKIDTAVSLAVVVGLLAWELRLCF